MNIPADLLYTEEHEWIKIDDDIATVGITDYAQGELGDVVFVELPETGTDLEKMQVFGTIEAVKAVSDLFSPLAGTITEANDMLADTPELVNSDPYGDGWMIKIKLSDPELTKELLDSATYTSKIS